MTSFIDIEMAGVAGAMEAFNEIEKELTMLWNAMQDRCPPTLTSKVHSELYGKIFALYTRSPDKTLKIFYNPKGVIVLWLHNLIRKELDHLNGDGRDVVYQIANIFMSFHVLMKAICLIFLCCEPHYQNRKLDCFSCLTINNKQHSSMEKLLLQAFSTGPISDKKGIIMQLICEELDRARDGDDNDVQMEKLRSIFDIFGLVHDGGTVECIDYIKYREVSLIYKEDIIDPYIRASLRFYQRKVHDIFSGGVHSIDMASYASKALEWVNQEVSWAKSLLKVNRTTYQRNHVTLEKEIRMALTRMLIYDKLEAVINNPTTGVRFVLSQYPDKAARSQLKTLFAFAKESSNAITVVHNEGNNPPIKDTEGMDIFCEAIVLFVSEQFRGIIEKYERSCGVRPAPEFAFIEECSSSWEKLLLAIADCGHLGRVHEAVKAKASAILKGNIIRTIEEESLGKGKDSHAQVTRTNTVLSLPIELSVYFDYLMREKSDNERLIVLSHLLPIIEEKDKFTNVFMKYFKARIFEGITDIAEESKLKKCLTVYNTMMFTENPSYEATFSDCARSESIANNLQDCFNSNMSLSLRVYRKGLWIDLVPIPIYSIRPSVRMIPVIQEQLRIIEDVYKSKFKHQTIEWSWINSSATVEIRRNEGGTPKGISPLGMQHCKDLIFGNLLAVSAFLYINESGTDGLTLSDILSKLNIETDKEGAVCLFNFIIRRSLELKLICPKSQSNRNISSSTSFVVNPTFIDENKLRRVLIYAPQTEREKRNSVDIETEMIPLRQKRIQTVIVRLMKSRKELYFDDIVDGTMSALTVFKSNRKDIKAQIELLIDQGMIQRSRDDCNKFQYLT